MKPAVGNQTALSRELSAKILRAAPVKGRHYKKEVNNKQADKKPYEHEYGIHVDFLRFLMIMYKWVLINPIKIVGATFGRPQRGLYASSSASAALPASGLLSPWRTNSIVTNAAAEKKAAYGKRILYPIESFSIKNPENIGVTI
ncbi:hypothetical protein SDC9_119787 [bioreactor metagenome]|uniref:Uncharacterized protein n=1 Tax=bioreactor metagenome TaxID=1076179 RepID=A0A645C751_9ZZZZ